MAECCANHAKDLVGDRRISFLVWRLPLAIFVGGFFASPGLRAALWVVSLTVAGVACLVNASRCGRVHCYFTGPLFLLGAATSLAQGLRLLPLGPRGLIWIGIAVIAASCILSFLPERIWGKYRSSIPKRGIRARQGRAIQETEGG